VSSEPTASRQNVARWIAAYEARWRAPGTGALAGIITPDRTCRQGAGLTCCWRDW
jgi:hypothetical protein